MYTSTEERQRGAGSAAASTKNAANTNATATMPRRAEYTRAGRGTASRSRASAVTGSTAQNYRGLNFAEPGQPEPAIRQKSAQTGRGPRRLGSQQVVSVRGRRVNPVKRVTTRARLSIVAIVMMIGGIIFAIWLSGVATQQTFRVQMLTAEESQLNNELETLHRDLENVRSAAEIAGHAVEEGLEIPVNPGILRREENGDIVEDRPASAETRPIIDVNGEPVRPGQASSDPDGIGELRERLESIPEGRRGIPYPQAGALQAPEGAAAEVGGPAGAQPAPQDRGDGERGPAPEHDSAPGQPAEPENNEAVIQAPYQPNFR